MPVVPRPALIVVERVPRDAHQQCGLPSTGAPPVCRERHEELLAAEPTGPCVNRSPWRPYPAHGDTELRHRRRRDASRITCNVGDTVAKRRAAGCAHSRDHPTHHGDGKWVEGLRRPTRYFRTAARVVAAVAGSRADPRASELSRRAARAARPDGCARTQGRAARRVGTSVEVRG